MTTTTTAPAAGTAPSAGTPAAGTSASATRSGPSQPAVRRGLRVAAVLLVIVVGYAALSAVFARPSGEGYLDTTSPLPDGTRALASILSDRGIDVRATGDVHDVFDSQPATVVVIFPGLLNAWQLKMLGKLDDTGHDIVLVAPDEAVLESLDLPVSELGAAGNAVIDPECDLPEARVAGDARIGGDHTYGDARSDDAGTTTVTTCYLTGDTQAALAVVADTSTPSGSEPGQTGPGSEEDEPGRIVVVGDAAFMTNRYLDDNGNAALALGLLSRHEDLSWLIPTTPSDEPVSASLFDLLGDRFWLVGSQILAALAVLALWRGRRLGPVVREGLPVVVRAAETVEGRGRLYASAQARDRAAAALRASAAARLADRLGVATRVPTGAGPGAPAVPIGGPGAPAVPIGGPGAPAVPIGGPDPTALVASVADHTGRSPVEIGALLYGSDMTYRSARDGDSGASGPDDDTLLRLALALDDLDRQVGSQ